MYYITPLNSGSRRCFLSNWRMLSTDAALLAKIGTFYKKRLRSQLGGQNKL